MGNYTTNQQWVVDADWGVNGYAVVSPITWDIGYKGSPHKVVVPLGFRFDLSIPPYLTWLFSPTDQRCLKAAALHDYMIMGLWDRPTAAGIFNDALRADGVSALKRLAMYLAVALWKWD